MRHVNAVQVTWLPCRSSGKHKRTLWQRAQPRGAHSLSKAASEHSEGCAKGASPRGRAGVRRLGIRYNMHQVHHIICTGNLVILGEHNATAELLCIARMHVVAHATG